VTRQRFGIWLVRRGTALGLDTAAICAFRGGADAGVWVREISCCSNCCTNRSFRVEHPLRSAPISGAAHAHRHLHDFKASTGIVILAVLESAPTNL
jgi:hypothetical protein